MDRYMRRLKRDVAVSAPLGECIRLRREARRLTQAELARDLKGSIPTISRLENGYRDLLVTEFVALARALGIRASTLLRGAENKAGPA
jgi:transcriptional regulator with XRE-family HTH domain